MSLNNAEIQQIHVILDGEHGELLRQIVFMLANAEYTCKGIPDSLLCLKEEFRYDYEMTLLKKSAGGCMSYEDDSKCPKIVNYPCRISKRNKRCGRCGKIIPKGPLLNARWIDPDVFCKCEKTEDQDTKVIQFRKRV